MNRLEIKLKQHTPLIHFQHDQEGATLRASEVKPKLDRFVLTRLGQGNYQVGIAQAKTNGWLVGKGGHPALDYKMRIEADGYIDSVKLLVNMNPKGKYYTYFINAQGKEESFPFLLANMGGKDSEDELMNLSQYKSLDITIRTCKDKIANSIYEAIESFFALNNFGQRTTKGFGSFSVEKKRLDENEWVVINWKDNFRKYFDHGTPIFKFSLANSDAFGDQLMLFSVIDFYWKCLKSGVNYTKRLVPNNGSGNVIIRYKERYIKAFLWTYLNSKGYTWEKRKLKEYFNLETTYPTRQYTDNNNDVIFARGLMGCPDKYEYRIPQNTFYQKGNKYKEEIETHTINISNNEIERIASPIIFKPILDGRNVIVYVLFDSDLINHLSELPQNSRSFKFKENSHEEIIAINPESIDYKELIRRFHYHLFTNPDFLQSTLGNYDRNNWLPAKIALIKDKDGKVISRKWGAVDISWKMVPRNFSWENILDSKDNGQNKFVSFAQVIRKD